MMYGSWDMEHSRQNFLLTGLPFAQDLSLKNSLDSYLCFPLALNHSAFYFIFLYWSPSSTLCMFSNFISSKIDEVFLINASAVFAFGDFNVHRRDWLIYSGGTDWPGELCYNFSQITFLKWLTFPLGLQIVILVVMLFRI